MEANDKENHNDVDNRKPKEHDKKKLNEDLVVFMRKRSDADLRRYTDRLKSFVDIQQKRCRATAARQRHANHHYHTAEAPVGIVRRDANCERATSEDSTATRSRRNPATEEKKAVRGRSSDSRSDEPSDRRCRRRRRRRSRCRRRRRRRRSRSRCRRRRRRRSRCRRRRRRRSRCRRRRRRRSRCRRRRRRRSCRRRRRRRSCRRRRRRC